MYTDNIPSTDSCVLLNPVECGTGTHNFMVKNEDLALQLSESFDCGIIADPNEFDLYN